MKVFTTLGDGINRLQFTEQATPEIGANEVLVKMIAAALNYRDLLVIKGIEHWKPQAPRIPVSDGVGEIVAIGANVKKWKVGDRVAGIFLPKWLDGKLTVENGAGALGGAAVDGVLAEFVKFDEETIVKIPGNLSAAESATLPVAGITAWHAVTRSNIQSGETVLIHGTGGVSLFALQFAKALGALPIITSSSDAKLAKASDLGVYATINYKTHPDWAERISELIGSEAVDHVVETVGGENLNKSLLAVKTSGTISFIGLLAGLSAPINTYQFVQKNVSIYGIETGSREMFEKMNAFIESHSIKPVIDKAFELGEFQEALRYLESGSHFGKIVINF